MVKYIWFLGASIYPVSYIITIIIRLIGGKNNLLGFPESFMAWLNIMLFDLVINRLFGINLAQINTIILPFIWFLFILFLFLINMSLFVLIVSFFPKDWKLSIIFILYITLLIINCYIPEINL